MCSPNREKHSGRRSVLVVLAVAAGICEAPGADQLLNDIGDIGLVFDLLGEEERLRAAAEEAGHMAEVVGRRIAHPMDDFGGSRSKAKAQPPVTAGECEDPQRGALLLVLGIRQRGLREEGLRDTEIRREVRDRRADGGLAEVALGDLHCAHGPGARGTGASSQHRHGSAAVAKQGGNGRAKLV
eukprot:CAMPEP_0170227420 /NCGR_PEP_ID=MMETSP0116_2-20130129/13424_1 /TAXON_ID=400756 /ORGANISM="Durinskia baltica, Strain CSIRO CS-38" /LENGTH=183 /DNA_ID=CAMNT_0010478151 /DNA_START=63 /DNA_END=615 /DNA_ORIENTATION=+